MTRIFDALKKAGASRSAPVPTPMPAYEPSIGGAAASRAPEERTPQPIHGYPLAGAIGLADDVLQQMTSLRVSLESALGERTPRTVAFVSSQSGEGTTTVAHQFAASLARDEGQRTVILDGNAREPSLRFEPEHRVVRLVGPGRARGGEALGVAMNLHGWPLPDDILQAGLLHPGAARAIVEGLAASYDWVVLDLPAALETPDAAAVAAIADGVVLVVQSGRTKRPVVSRSVDLLRKAGARVLGTVLNRRRLEIPEFIYKRI